MKVAIKVRLKNGILDPQGKTVQQALEHLGYEHLSNVRVGKLIEFELGSSVTEEQAEKMANEMSERLLANPVMEVFDVEISK